MAFTTHYCPWCCSTTRDPKKYTYWAKAVKIDSVEMIFVVLLQLQLQLQLVWSHVLARWQRSAHLLQAEVVVLPLREDPPLRLHLDPFQLGLLPELRLELDRFPSDLLLPGRQLLRE